MRWGRAQLPGAVNNGEFKTPAQIHSRLMCQLAHLHFYRGGKKEAVLEDLLRILKFSFKLPRKGGIESLTVLVTQQYIIVYRTSLVCEKVMLKK